MQGMSARLRTDRVRHMRRRRGLLHGRRQLLVPRQAGLQHGLRRAQAAAAHAAAKLGAWRHARQAAR